MLAIVLLRNIRGDYFLFNQLVLSQNGERDIHNQQPGVACRQVEFWQRPLDGHLAEFCVPYRKPADKGGMIQGFPSIEAMVLLFHIMWIMRNLQLLSRPRAVLQDLGLFLLWR